MKQKKRWMPIQTKKPTAKLSDLKKAEIEKRCQPLVEQFKLQYINENPDRIEPEFKKYFVRLEYVESDSFNFSYFRHTGAWFLVATNLLLNDCFEMIESNPNFHPIG